MVLLNKFSENLHYTFSVSYSHGLFVMNVRHPLQELCVGGGGGGNCKVIKLRDANKIHVKLWWLVAAWSQRHQFLYNYIIL